MAKITHPIFMISCCLLLIHQAIEKVFLLKIPFLDNYGDDFLALPIVLTIFSFEQHHLWKRIQRPLTVVEITVFTIAFAVFFEEILPNFNQNYTKDYWDYLAYGLGSLLFFLAQSDLGGLNFKYF